MSYRVYYTEQAESDLKAIYEYIAYTLLVPETAKKITGRIMTEISSLNEMPMRYPLYKKEPWKSKGLRNFSVGNYMVFYLPVEDKNAVAVIRIMYGGRNIEKQLAEDI